MGDCREITASCAQRLHRLDGRTRRGVLPVARRADRAVGLLGLSGVVAIVAGVALNRPARKAPWLLLAVAQLSFVAGQLSFLMAGLLGTQLPFPSFADMLYLATYPMYAVALLIFIRWRTPDRDRRSLIDALTLTAGLGLLSWIYLILPYRSEE